MSTELKSKIIQFEGNITQDDINHLLSVFPAGCVFFDVETTGLSPLMDRIVELAAIKITPAGVQIMSSLANPQMPIPENVISIHGISDDDVKDAPLSEDVAKEFFTFIEKLPILAHNARFDVGFVLFGAFEYFKSIKNLHCNQIYCTCQYSRKAFPQFNSHRLAYLTQELNIDLKSHHRALDDTLAILKIMVEGLKKLPEVVHRYSIADGILGKLSDYHPSNPIPIPKHLLGLQEKVRLQEIVEIKYSGGSHKGIFRPIRPISFLPTPRGNTLYAQCLLSDLYKSFSLKKIVGWREKEQNLET